MVRAPPSGESTFMSAASGRVQGRLGAPPGIGLAEQRIEGDGGGHQRRQAPGGDRQDPPLQALFLHPISHSADPNHTPPGSTPDPPCRTLHRLRLTASFRPGCSPGPPSLTQNNPRPFRTVQLRTDSPDDGDVLEVPGRMRYLGTLMLLASVGMLLFPSLWEGRWPAGPVRTRTRASRRSRRRPRSRLARAPRRQRRLSFSGPRPI